jgi:NADPH2:quinone reductase
MDGVGPAIHEVAMRAIRIHATGGADLLRLEEVPEPVPGPGQALVEIKAIGVNFIEVYQRTGLYPVPVPYTPGNEAAGVVVAVGPGVVAVRPGDRVVSMGVAGAYAERALVNAERLVPLPSGLSFRDGAAVLLQGITAHFLAVSTCPLKQGDRCLIHAAAGGVGLLLCQIAARRGAWIAGTVSTPEKAALAREAGAHEVILYTEQDFAHEVRRLTSAMGVQVVYDSVGKSTFEKSLDCLAPRGMLVLYGQSSGPVPPFDPQLLNRKGSLYLTRPTISHYTATRDELQSRANEVLGWVSDGSLRVRIDRELPLEQAADAHRALEGRLTKGKVVLTP